MLRDYNKSKQNEYTNCRDLKRDKIVMWQHDYYVPLALVTNIGFPVALGLLYGDVWGMLLVVGAVRLFMSHHTTFLSIHWLMFGVNRRLLTKIQRVIMESWPFYLWRGLP